jgi:hypothetical protein
MEALLKAFDGGINSLLEYIASTPSVHNDTKKYLNKIKKEKIKKALHDKYNKGA